MFSSFREASLEEEYSLNLISKLKSIHIQKESMKVSNREARYIAYCNEFIVKLL